MENNAIKSYVTFVLKVFEDGSDTKQELIYDLEDYPLVESGMPKFLPDDCMYFFFFEGILDTETQEFSFKNPEDPDMVYYVNADILTEEELLLEFENCEDIISDVREIRSESGDRFGEILRLPDDIILVSTTAFKILDYIPVNLGIEQLN